MRYGKIRIQPKILTDMLLITTDRIRATRRVTDLPDDIRLLDLTFEQDTQTWVLTLAGSGAPLIKVAEGATIPFIDPFILTEE